MVPTCPMLPDVWVVEGQVRLAVLSTPAVQAPPEVARVAGTSAGAGGLSSALRAASGEKKEKARRREKRWRAPLVSETKARSRHRCRG